MATQVGNAYIPVRPDMSQFGREVEAGTKGAMGSLKNFAKTAAITLGGAFAVTKGVDFLKGSIGAASDLNETVSKARTIFGPAADELERWASGSAKAFGQSKQQALDAAGTFGNLFVQLGIGSEKASGMSTAMVELASDFASFHNADPTEVINAQTAAFRGEFDALQRFVPTINAAAVAQKALEQTGKKTTKQLTEQDKALAVQALMMEGAGDAAGDFARTSDGLANKQRIASAQWADMTAKIGSGLLPVMTSLMGFVSTKLLPGIESIGRALAAGARFVDDHRELFIGLGVGIVAVLVPALIAQATAGFTAAAAGLAVAAAWIAANAPLIAIGLAVAALTAAVIWAYKNVDWFRALIDTVARFLTGTVWPAIQRGARLFTDVLVPAIKTVITWYWNFYRDVAEVVLKVLGKLGGIVSFMAGLPGKIRGAATRGFDALKNLAEAAVRFVLRQLDKLLGPLDEIAGKVGGVIGKVGGVIGKIPGFAGGVSNFTGGLALVGEGGPELVNLPRGSDVIPSRRSMAMLAAGAQGPSLAGVQIVVDRRVLGELMREDEYRYQLQNL